MAFTKITEEDTANKGVVGLPDTPNLSTQAMEEKFDELALEVLLPKHNGLIDELADKTAAANIGAVDALGEATTVQAMIDRAVQSGYTKAETDALLSNKVDREQGKGLTTNDFSDAYKYKLNNIEDNANNYVLPKATSGSLGGVMPDNTTFTVDENGVGHAIGGGGGGTPDFNALVNKPIMNGVTIMGDKTSEDYGLLRPYIVVTSDAGSTVSISKGGVTIQAEQITSTTWGVYPTSYGSWTVKSELSGADDSTATVVVDTVKTYAISVNHISATITVTYPSGASCVLSKGAIEYVATSSPQTFTVQSIGTWTVTTTLDGVVKTATVSITADGQSQSVTVEYVEIEVTYGNDFEGETITCTDGVDTYTKTASGGKVSFFIPAYGSTWTISSEASGTPYSTSVTVTEFTKYTVVLNVFSATVTVTFPYSKGATCTLSDGNTTLTATTSPMAFNVGNTGTWVATVTLDNIVKSDSVSITTDGQTEALTIEYGEIELIFDNEFRGLSVICNSGVTNIIKTAPISGNTMYFYPPSTGEWTISSTYSGNSYSTSATVTSLSVQASAILKLRPNGQTVTPTDDIQTWLQCGGIFDKSYTTLSEVLSDSTTLSTLINDNNAVDYMVRSKTWAKSWNDLCTEQSYTFSGSTSTDVPLSNANGVGKFRLYMTAQSSNGAGSGLKLQLYDSNNTALVPNMTSATAPSGTVSQSGQLTNYEAWKAFSTTQSNGWFAQNSIGYGANDYIGYEFTSAVNATKATVSMVNANSTTLHFKIQKYETAITEDSTAMSYIGLNNYCANTLLADSDWLNAICNSTYFESVLNVKAPQMTDNTHPSGIASDSDNSSSAYKGLGVYAEDPNYANLENNQNAKVMYEFPSTVTIYKIYMHLRNGSSLSRSFNYKASGSADGSTWNDMFSGIAWNDSGNGDTTNTVIATNPITAKHFAGDCYVGTKDGSNKYSVRMKVQFYGRIDV